MMATKTGLKAAQKATPVVPCSTQKRSKKLVFGVRLRCKTALARVLRSKKKTTTCVTKKAKGKTQGKTLTKAKSKSYEVVAIPKKSMPSGKEPRKYEYDTLYNIPDLSPDTKGRALSKRISQETYEEWSPMASKDADFTQTSTSVKTKLEPTKTVPPPLRSPEAEQRAAKGRIPIVKAQKLLTAKTESHRTAYDSAIRRKIYCCAVLIFVTCAITAITLTIIIVLIYLGYVSFA